MWSDDAASRNTLQCRILRAAALAPLLFLLNACGPDAAARNAGVSPPPGAGPQAAAAPAAISAAAEQANGLARSIGCLACHALDKKLLGPAWRTVAAVNRDDAAASRRLMDKIATGGSGVWGNIDMPGYPQLSETTRAELVEYILSLR